MILKGKVVDIKSYEIKNGKVVNLYIREDPPYSVIYHATLWKDLAEKVGSRLQVDDSITVSAYASGIENGQINLADFNVVDAKRPVILEHIAIFDEVIAEPGKDGDSDDR